MTLGDGTAVALKSINFDGVTSVESNPRSRRASFGNVTVTALQGNGAVDIFSRATAGALLQSVVLTERDARGALLVSWTLNGVLIASDGVSGAGTDRPIETYVLSHSTVTETTPSGHSGRENTATWNVRTSTGQLEGTPQVSAKPGSDTLALPGITGLISVDSFSLDFASSLSKGATATASDLTVTAMVNSASPKVFFDAASGQLLDLAVLTAYSPDRVDFTTWTLTNVYITAYVDHGGVDTFTLSFTAITEKHTGHIPGGKTPLASEVAWNFATNQGQTTGVVASDFDPRTPPEIGMTVGDDTRSTVDGFELGSVSSTVRTGNPRTVSHGPSTIHKPIGNSSVDLLAALLTGRVINTARVDFRDPATKRLTIFGLSSFRVVGLRVSGVSGQAPQESYKFANVH